MPAASAPHHPTLSQISGQQNTLSWSFGASSDEGARMYYEAQWTANSNSSNGVLTHSLTQSFGNGASGMRVGYPYELSGSSGYYHGLVPRGHQTGLDLQAGTTYYLQWRGVDKSGPGQWSPIRSATTVAGATAPNAPNQPTVTDIQDTQFTFSWNSVTGASNYKVYGGTSAGPSVSGTLLATQTGTSYTWTSRTANQTYYVAVIATNSNGDSSPSSDRVVKTMVVDPSAPTAAQSTPVQNTISWSNVTGTVKTRLFGGTSSNPTTTLTTVTSGTTSYTHTGLTPGTTYYYRIKQTNDNGETYFSDYSSQDSVTTIALTAPSNVTGTPAATDNTIQWTEPTYSTRTYIYWSASSGGSYAAAYSGANPAYVGDGVTTFNVDDYYTAYQGQVLLSGDNDVEYIKLKAYFDGHYSGYSSEYAAYSLPGTPTNLSAAQGSGEGEIDLTWTSTTGEGALTVTYTISRSTSSGGSYSVIGSNISSGTTSLTDTGLDASTTYYYKIIAVTSAGNSPDSSVVNATTAATSGPNPSNEVLEFGKLNVLVNRGSDGANVSMNDVTGDTNEASLKDFYVGTFSSISGVGTTQVIGNSGYLVIIANFGNAGDRFKNLVNASRFSFSITAGSSFANLSNQSGRTIRLNTAGTFGSHSVTVSCTWTPIFNDHITSNLTRTANFQMVRI